MGTILDYLDWRGDLSFDASPFNEVDNLIFSWMSYVELKGIVSGSMNSWISLKEAAEIYQRTHDMEADKKIVSFTKSAAPLFIEMAKTRRYQDVKLCYYQNKIDIQHEIQFAAVTIQISPDLLFIAYRGTDHTIVGWKEDFNMAYLEQVPSQVEALAYLQQAAEKWKGTLLLGGHSKGGNLAIYAGVHAPETIQSRIAGIYNNDGPGFSSAMMEDPAYQTMLPRIYSYVPQSSIVGMLLEHGESYRIVKSIQKGIWQHDALSWEVVGPHFVELENTTVASQLTDATLTSWLATMDNAQREAFVATLFSVLETTGAKTLTDLTTGALKNISTILKSLGSLSKEEKSRMTSAITQLFKTGNEMLKKQIEEELPELLPHSSEDKK